MDHKDDSLNGVISGLYDAALAPSHWERVLPQLCEAFDCIAITIITFDQSSGAVLIALSHGIDMEALQSYEQGVQAIDPLRTYALANPEQQLYFEYQHTPEQALDTSPFHQVLEQRTGIRYRFAGKLFEADGAVAYATLQRSRDQGHPDTDTLARFSRIIPHLSRAVRIANRLGDLELRASAATAVMEDLPVAILLLGADNRVLYANAAASAILAEGDALAVGREGLYALRQGDNRALQELLRSAGDPHSPSGGPLSLPRRSGLSAYALQIAPLALDNVLFATLRPTVAVFIADPEQSAVLPAGRLARLFGLTPRQAELACLLVEGLSLDQIAERMEVKLKTVRSHLETVFKKTGTRRQSDLLGLLLRIVLPTDR